MWHFSCSILCLTLQAPGNARGSRHWALGTGKDQGGEHLLLLHFSLLIARASHAPHAYLRPGSFLWVFFCCFLFGFLLLFWFGVFVCLFFGFGLVGGFFKWQIH